MGEEIAKGSCLCGAVGFELALPVLWFGYCHCSRCRKISGAAASAVAGVLPDKFRWTKGFEELACFDLPGATIFASCFCWHCGSTMPHPTRSGDDMVIVPMGSLDDAVSAHGELPLAIARRLVCARERIADRRLKHGDPR